jgi:hypothetical protein
MLAISRFDFRPTAESSNTATELGFRSASEHSHLSVLLSALKSGNSSRYTSGSSHGSMPDSFNSSIDTVARSKSTDRPVA